ncbi:MAG: excinuclease ABC subunit UvrA, partial [Terriglobales bacterium]
LGPGATDPAFRRRLHAFATSRRIPLQRPVAELSPKQRQELVQGEGDFDGIGGHLEAMWEDASMDSAREWLLGVTSPAPCPGCQGRRLRPESLAVSVGVRSIAAFTALPVSDATTAAAELERAIQARPRQRALAGRIISEVRERLGFLLEVGLGYLSLDRAAGTLSGGEAQRIRLAGQIGSRLRGVLYVLDEPSIGLHPRDNGRLLASLTRLRDLGNTVLVVEHDRETIERADYILDLGPGAGRMGGTLVAQGTPAAVAATPGSLTGAYLAGREQVPVPSQRRGADPGRGITVYGARAHNLRNLEVFFPAGLLTVLTGVSGAGKSTLVDDILYPALAARYFRALAAPAEHDRIEGAEHFDKVIRIDQDPIGRTPRSNAATYTGLLTPIRELFAQLPEARARGYAIGRFSFNIRGGRCEACQGDGQKRIEMNFLPDVYVRCDVCRGRRYNQETLAVQFKGRSIADVLEATVEEARELFENVPAVRRKLDTLSQVGLGYLHLGQSATTVSGGEAQRIKLARELSRKQTGRTLYLLDEPTTGLHFEDVKHLLRVLQALVDLGNTVLIIEHNLDVIKAADWIIDLGPEGGAGGGQLVAAGTPEQVAKVKASLTGQALKVAFRAQPSALRPKQ